MSSERLLALALGLLLAGCGGRASVLDRSCAFETGVVEGDWLPLFGGHSYDWLYLSHRVAYLRAGVERPDPDGSFGVPLGLIGGDWSTGQFADDYPWYRVEHQRVSTDAVQGWFGTTTMTVPTTGHAQQRVTIDLDATKLPADGDKIVVLQGLCFDTARPLGRDYAGSYDPALGWTVRGFGVGVEAVGASEDTLDLDVSAHFQAGPLDREDLNEAIPHSEVQATVAYAVLNLPDGVLTPAEHHSSMFFPSQGESYSETPLPPDDERTATVEGVAGYPTAVPVLQGFDFELNAAHDPDRAGRYLRGWHARVDAFDYDPDTGAADIRIDGWASHSSAFQEGDLEVEFHARLGLLQLPESATPHAGSTAGHFEIGKPLGSRHERVPPPTATD